MTNVSHLIMKSTKQFYSLKQSCSFFDQSLGYEYKYALDTMVLAWYGFSLCCCVSLFYGDSLCYNTINGVSLFCGVIPCMVGRGL